MITTAVTPWYPTDVSPATGSFVRKDLQAISSSGVQVRCVHLVAPRLVDDRGTDRVAGSDVKLVQLKMDPLNPLQVVLTAEKLVDYLRGSEVIHSMAMSSLLPVALARFLGGQSLREIPWVHTEHWSAMSSPEGHARKYRLMKPIVGLLEKLPDVVTSVCPYLSDPLRSLRGSGVTVDIPCVVDTPECLASRERHDGPWRLIAVGGMVERKDPLLTVEIAHEVQRLGYPVELTWVGNGPLLGETRLLAQSLGVPLRLTGSVDYSQVSEEFLRSDLFVLPTHGDNFFVSCAEAIVHGLPVVVSDQGGHKDYVRQPIAGKILSGFEPKEYANAIVEILQPWFESGQGYSSAEISGTLADGFSAVEVGRSYNRVYTSVRESIRNDDRTILSNLPDELPSWNGM